MNLLEARSVEQWSRGGFPGIAEEIRRGRSIKERKRMLGTILLIVLILLLLGALPTWPYSRSWGYYPSGVVGLIVVIVVFLVLTGRLG